MQTNESSIEMTLHKHTFTEFVEFPDHDKRTESAEFRKNKRVLVKQLDLPCFVCGSRDQREVHHIHEWALWNALDFEKVLDTLHVFDPYGFTHKMGEALATPPAAQRQCNVKTIKFYAMTLLALSLSGCSTLEIQSELIGRFSRVGQTETSKSMLIEWVQTSEVNFFCEPYFKNIGRPYPNLGVHACAVHNREMGVCKIITGVETSYAILGHETRHCFDGDYH